MSEDDSIRELWARQETGSFAMPLEEVRRKASSFQNTIRRRNMMEYAASIFVLIAFGGVAVTVPDWGVRAGAALIMAGTLYVVWKLHTMARAAGAGEIDAALSLTDFHQGELLRQRAALATVWRWYLIPFVPGMIVFLSAVSFTPDNPTPLAAKLTVFLFSLGIVGALFAGIAWLNGRAVKALDAEIAALEEGADA
ncbi:MAG: hypothetical protein CVT79_11075 [Alphaproteobacteria bacterium HGW-Alphaproteobacteria-18]|nr:MAG: hypothetical protein CVT79_11075 [Alphaproteobacteria bacterium HGW-Alphaproteobacteria-18]